MRCHISALTRDDYFLSIDSYGLNLYKFLSKDVYESWFPESNSKVSVLYYTQNEKVRKLSGTDVVLVKHSDISRCNGGQIRVQTSLVEHFLRNYPQDADKVVIFRSQDPFINDNQTSSSSSANSNNNSRNFSSASCNSILSNGRDISTKSSNFFRSQFTSSTNDTVNQKHLSNRSTGSSQASSSSSGNRRSNTDITDNPVRSSLSQIVTYNSVSESDREFLKRNSGGSLIDRKKRDNLIDQNAQPKLSTYASLFEVKSKTDRSSASQNKKQKKSEEGSSGNVIDLLDDTDSDADESENKVETDVEVESLFMHHRFIVVKRLLDEKFILCQVCIVSSVTSLSCLSFFILVDHERNYDLELKYLI